MIRNAKKKNCHVLEGQSMRSIYVTSILLSLLQNNWVLLVLMGIIAYFRKEVKVTANYYLCIITIVIFESDKRRKIHLQTKFYLLVMRTLMTIDVGKRAEWVEDFIDKEVV